MSCISKRPFQNSSSSYRLCFGTTRKMMELWSSWHSLRMKLYLLISCLTSLLCHLVGFYFGAVHPDVEFWLRLQRVEKPIRLLLVLLTNQLVEIFVNRKPNSFQLTLLPCSNRQALLKRYFCFGCTPKESLCFWPCFQLG